MKNKITPKQAEFCNQYLVDLNGTQAAIRAGYSKRRASEIGYQLLQKTTIQEYLTKLQAKAREKTDLSKEEVLSELAAILRAKITDYLYFNGYQVVFKSFDNLTEAQIKAIESIKENRYGEIELKLHGKSWTVDRICKILGFNSTQDFNINLEKLDESVLDALIQRLIPKNK